MILKNIFLNINMVLKNNKLKKRQFISDKQSFFFTQIKIILFDYFRNSFLSVRLSFDFVIVSIVRGNVALFKPSKRVILKLFLSKSPKSGHFLVWLSKSFMMYEIYWMCSKKEKIYYFANAFLRLGALLS